MSGPDDLLELQLSDTSIEQLRYRLPRLPEVVAATAAANEVTAWEKRRDELQQQMASFDAAIAAAEKASAELSKKRSRFDSQLKTVISPREAEALMSEIAQINAHRSALDDDELEAMEGLGAAEAELGEHTVSEERLRAAAAAADEAAQAAREAIDAQITELQSVRESLRGRIDAALLQRYDVMRGQLDGVAIAKLNGLRCEGCHIDMSRAEADDIKRLPPDALPECPNCGRLLVR